MTPVVRVLLIYAPGLDEPFLLIPSEQYRVCTSDSCRSVPEFIRRAIDAHPGARAVAETWSFVQFSWNDPMFPPWRIPAPKRAALATA